VELSTNYSNVQTVTLDRERSADPAVGIIDGLGAPHCFQLFDTRPTPEHNKDTTAKKF
jgi:hypothetical protein